MILDKGQWLKKKVKFSSHKRLIKAFRLNDTLGEEILAGRKFGGIGGFGKNPPN